MGQQEIYTFLKNHSGEWYTAREIQKNNMCRTTTIYACLARLAKSGFLENRKTKMGAHTISEWRVINDKKKM